MNNTNDKTMFLVRNALLSAIIVFMAITPLGYLNIGPFAVTFLTVPVIIGAVTLGTGSGAFLGLVFGLTSFFNAFKSPMGTMLLSISPVYTAILCIVPRVLEGYLCALVFKLLNSKKDNKIWKITLSSLSCPVLNTILYMSFLVILFGNTQYIQNMRQGQSIIMFIVTFVGVQAVVEAVVCTIIGSAVSTSILKYFKSEK